MTSEEKLTDAFMQAIGLSSDTDFSAVQYGVTDGWDSVAHMQLVATIERSFDIMFSSDQVIGMSSYTKAREIVEAHGVVFTV